MRNYTPKEEKRAELEGDEMVEDLAIAALSEVEVCPGYTLGEAIRDAILELQVDCVHEWRKTPTGKACSKCHTFIKS